MCFVQTSLRFKEPFKFDLCIYSPAAGECSCALTLFFQPVYVYFLLNPDFVCLARHILGYDAAAPCALARLMWANARGDLAIVHGFTVQL